MTDPQQPVFPPELEELIFGFAIRDNLIFAGQLSLVANRVRQWIIPYLYEIDIFSFGQELYAPHSNLPLDSLSGHGIHTRHLLIQSLESPVGADYDGCVRKCPNLRTLALWTSDIIPFTPQLIETLSTLRLIYLSIDVDALSCALTEQDRNLTSMIFPTVTHLELIGIVESVTCNQLQVCFPALTHLAIMAFGGTPISFMQEALIVFGDQLKVLVWYMSQVGVDEASKLPSVVPTPYYVEVDDARVVVLRYGSSGIGSWLEGAKGGFGIWRVADEAVRTRLQGL